MAERNYRVWCAMNDVPIDEGVEEGDDEDADEEMDVDDDIGPLGGTFEALPVGDDDGVEAGQEGEDDEEEWGGIMDVDEEDDDTTLSFSKELKAAEAPTPIYKTPSRRKKTKVAKLVREKIRKVLEDVTKLADKRAGKCDENDFLRLLYAFNAEGLHFA